MEQKQPDSADQSRRAFLKTARSMGAVSALAFAAGGAQAAETKPDPAQAAPEAKGYRETEHILKYYRTARYW
ncbi:MAG: formate dehydrogenase [Telluria sp.]